LAGGLSAISSVMVIFGLEETLPSKCSTDDCQPAGKGATLSGKAGYRTVPADDVDVLVAAEAGTKEELELGSLWRVSSKIDAAEAAEAKPQLLTGHNAGIGAAWGPPSLSEQQQEAVDATLPRLPSPAVVVVVCTADVEQGSCEGEAKSEQQQQSGTGAQLAKPVAAAGRPVPAAVVPAALLADLPWYRQPGIVRALLGYGLVAFVFNMLGERGFVFVDSCAWHAFVNFLQVEPRCVVYMAVKQHALTSLASFPRCR
jgi:hypothetical protein